MNFGNLNKSKSELNNLDICLRYGWNFHANHPHKPEPICKNFQQQKLLELQISVRLCCETHLHPVLPGLCVRLKKISPLEGVFVGRTFGRLIAQRDDK